LAKQADFILNATIGEEACPNNLAPTTSTTAHLALGDALAVCLLKMKDFTDRDFAELHPGGALGKQLYLKVNDLVDAKLLPVVKQDASLKEVIVEISGKRLGCTAVVDSQQNLLGIITDGDLRRMLEKGTSLSEVVAEDIMTKSPKTIEADEFAVKALHIMQEKSITQLVVLQEGKLKGFVHLHDLLKEGIV
jgi:arabinose-5-phosphate isomerase